MKRFMCLFLAFCLLFCFSCTAYAADGDTVFIGNPEEITNPIRESLGYISDKMDNLLTKTVWKDFLDHQFTSLDNTITNIWMELEKVTLQQQDDSIFFNTWYKEFLKAGIAEAEWMKAILQQVNLIYTNFNKYYEEKQLPALNLVNTWLESANGYLNTIDSSTTTIKTDVNSLFSGWTPGQNPFLYNNKSPTSWFGVVGLKINDLSNNLVKAKVDVTTMDDSNFGNSIWYKGVYGCLYRLQQVLADDSDLQMRQDTEENRTVFHDLFLNFNNSDSAVKPDQIVSVSNLSVDFQSNFDTKVDPLKLFDFLKDENPMAWFTQKCKDSMVSVPSSNTRRSPASSSPYGNYAAEHMQDYYNRLEGVKK